jgi:hypothetical protein
VTKTVTKNDVHWSDEEEEPKRPSRGRTDAQWTALYRDQWACQYHLHVLGVLVRATDGHHLFGRMNDVPEAIMALCHDCHMKLHNGQMIHNDTLVTIQVERGILDWRQAQKLKARKTIT